MKPILLLGLLLVPSMAAMADEVRFSHADPNEETAWTGTKKAERYDVAILLDDPALKGARITGIEIPASAASEVGGYSVWLSEELKLESKTNVPLVSTPAEVKEGWVTGRLETPYTIGDAPVYAGYTFEVSAVDALNDYDLAKYPVAVQQGKKANTLWMHTQRHYLKWGDKSEVLGGISSIRVVLEGEFEKVSASLTSTEPVKVQADVKELYIPVIVKSYGSQPLERLEFEYSFSGEAPKSVSYAFPQPVTPLFGQEMLLNVVVPNTYGVGQHDVALKVAEINGLPNANPYSTAEAMVTLVSKFPTKRPVVEEYTGLWCGYCPRGYVAMETMAEEHPDFIGIAFHNQDPMAITSDYPSEIGGFPSCFIDRKGDARNPSLKVLREAWPNNCRKYSPVALEVAASRSESNPTDIVARATALFVEKPEDDCLIAYVLLANGLTDPEWEQTNYFSNKYEADMDWFVEQPRKVKGLVFNDVAAMCSPYNGVEGSLPKRDAIAGYVDYTHDYTFATAGVLSTDGYDLIGNAGENLDVVAMVVDTVTGEILNAAQCRLGGSSTDGVISPEAAKEVVAVEFFDLTGRRCSPDAKGLTIRRTLYSNGTSTTEKQVR